MSILVSVLIVLTAVFGGAGATVYAAQNSAPETPLYGLKLASEDARLGMTVEQHSRLELQLAFTQRRMEEIAGLVQAGETLPELLITRWQAQFNNALQTCAQLSNEEILPAMLHIQEQLRLQEHLATQADPRGAAIQQVEQLRAEIQTRLRLVEDGLQDPNLFRERLRHGYGATDLETDQPGNPWTTGTPTPNSGYGPGPGDCEDCTPQGPQGNPEKPGNQNGAQNPWTTGTPTPNSSYGPGPGDCDDCTPQGPQYGGPQATKTTQPGYGPGDGSGGNGGSGPGDGSNDGNGPGDGGNDNSGPGDGGSGNGSNKP